MVVVCGMWLRSYPSSLWADEQAKWDDNRASHVRTVTSTGRTLPKRWNYGPILPHARGWNTPEQWAFYLLENPGKNPELLTEPQADDAATVDIQLITMYGDRALPRI